MQALFRATRHPDFKPVPGALIPLLIKAAPRSGSNVSRQQNVAATIGADAAAASTAFAQGLLDSDSEHAVKYAASQPYKHGVVDGLLNDALLTAAREEIVAELRFTEKETDIYKVNQTGDLANLDGLPDSEVGRLQNLLRVRNAIYSEPFRAWLMSVTGCGPLSAKNKDMSINDYRAGCHLLNHDDVIGTRRLSYILYLPDPSEDWKPEYGGALELYPTVSRGVPVNVPSVVIPPKWNQYTFFTVQPGHSFHSVEEVVDPSRSRLSISGWFHRPQPDEKGFDQQDKEREEEERKEHASAEGLASKKATASFKAYPEELNPPLPGSALSTVDRTYLAQFLNPAYLQPKTQAQLFERFGDESHILLADVLRPELASSLEKALKSADGEAGLRWWEKGGRGQARIPDHQTGVTERWKIVGPPHRQRYLSLVGKDELAKPALSNAPIPQPIPTDPESVLDLLRSHLFPSPAFRHFLANVTQLVPIGARPFETRRFRPGLDYTLARADSEAVLDICLGLTPDVGRSAIDASGGATAPKGLAAKKAAAKRAKTNATKSNGGITKAEAKELAQAWETGDVGGWEAYMAPANDEEDPAVYGGNVKKPKNEEGAPIQGDVDMRDAEVEEEDDEDEDEDEDDDGVLLNITPTWNTLSIALRDEGVMKFIKYLCASAGGSRWDVVGELEVGAAIEEEDDDVQG
ncbi:hypothetical protein IE81DRAFT_284553 [Ceraceosorus guamensis]|uniref:uS12 prolyl 3,4-dihydroxylase n=1 Tax=Ceraceosorus guamensis TaxID=1522189 RepID=A0A316WFM3_9BASI|nr:hypothetical protein IE81DRAFT_284553 [Ceraceosorus guamensis]PWN46055.1 hypothetical protein IE81DRAFT_284553 [Ceraceosorus guamensis]